MDVTTVALSGLNAASKRLEASANNIANANTPGFKADEVKQMPRETGGVNVDIVKSEAPTEDEGSNVELEREIANQQTATYDFKANLQVLKKQAALDKALLDIQA